MSRFKVGDKIVITQAVYIDGLGWNDFMSSHIGDIAVIQNQHPFHKNSYLLNDTNGNRLPFIWPGKSLIPYKLKGYQLSFPFMED